jgi:hypothetical protein
VLLHEQASSEKQAGDPPSLQRGFHRAVGAIGLRWRQASTRLSAAGRRSASCAHSVTFPNAGSDPGPFSIADASTSARSDACARAWACADACTCADACARADTRSGACAKSRSRSGAHAVTVAESYASTEPYSQPVSDSVADALCVGLLL